MKKKLIVANWKLNGNIEMISNYLKFLKKNLSSDLKKHIIVIAPPTIYLERMYENLTKMNIFLGAQNVDINLSGPFTGEISAIMLKDIGVKYVIIGHSERRMYHNETDYLIAKKFHLIKNQNLIPILCIGETEKEKKNGLTEKVIEKKINCIFEILGKKAFRNTVIAYEPIWAIGTGIPADPEYVQIIHKFIRNYIEKNDFMSKNIIIQYGGSINILNTKKFIEKPDIDGFLIGNASLHAKDFINIIKVSSDLN